MGIFYSEIEIGCSHVCVVHTKSPFTVELFSFTIVYTLVKILSRVYNSITKNRGVTLQGGLYL